MIYLVLKIEVHRKCKNYAFTSYYKQHHAYPITDKKLAGICSQYHKIICENYKHKQPI